jgi:hypothetical protein
VPPPMPPWCWCEHCGVVAAVAEPADPREEGEDWPDPGERCSAGRDGEVCAEPGPA